MNDQFEVGDEVEAFGCTGEVLKPIPGSKSMYIDVKFHDRECVRFLPDGRKESWHKTPSLKLIKKKKKPFRWEGECELHDVDFVTSAAIEHLYFVKKGHHFQGKIGVTSRCRITVEEIEE